MVNYDLIILSVILVPDHAVCYWINGSCEGILFHRYWNDD